jgi:hypothetical protein
LVRERELPCRYGWTHDLWELKKGRVVGMRVWGPFHGEPALDDLPGDLLGMLVRGALDEPIAGHDPLKVVNDRCLENDAGGEPEWRFDGPAG